MWVSVTSGRLIFMRTTISLIINENLQFFRFFPHFFARQMLGILFVCFFYRQPRHNYPTSINVYEIIWGWDLVLIGRYRCFCKLQRVSKFQTRESTRTACVRAWTPHDAKSARWKSAAAPECFRRTKSLQFLRRNSSRRYRCDCCCKTNPRSSFSSVRHGRLGRCSRRDFGPKVQSVKAKLKNVKTVNK